MTWQIDQVMFTFFCVQCTKWPRRWKAWASLWWRHGGLWRDTATRCCVWTGARTRGGSSAPPRSHTLWLLQCFNLNLTKKDIFLTGVRSFLITGCRMEKWSFGMLSPLTRSVVEILLLRKCIHLFWLHGDETATGVENNVKSQCMTAAFLIKAA